MSVLRDHWSLVNLLRQSSATVKAQNKSSATVQFRKIWTITERQLRNCKQPAEPSTVELNEVTQGLIRQVPQQFKLKTKVPQMSHTEVPQLSSSAFQGQMRNSTKPAELTIDQFNGVGQGWFESFLLTAESFWMEVFRKWKYPSLKH